jgi:3-oxoacyl-[acyl-carrier-protein] synthase-1
VNLLQNKIPVYVTNGNCVTPLGFNLVNNLQEIKNGQVAIDKITDESLQSESFYGAVIDKIKLKIAFSKLNYKGEFSTLEMMMLLAVDEIVVTYKEQFIDKCGIIFSSTKGNINALSTEDNTAYFLHHLAKKVSTAIGIKTEPIVLSNACVSGIMAISVAKRLIQTGVYNHFVVIGGDLFSKFVFSGFQSFQAISAQPCKPYDKTRDGITLGEASAAIFVTKNKALTESSFCYEIIGDSSINDANHISGPSRTGEGLFQSVNNAMKEVNIESSAIDCISSHGTATNFNDEMEAQAFNRAALENTPVFSLKACFGHTLGAAGLLETVISLAFADENLIPPSLGYNEDGLTLPLNINNEIQEKEVNIVLKTASGFGGSNTAVLFKKCTTDEK